MNTRITGSLEPFGFTIGPQPLNHITGCRVHQRIVFIDTKRTGTRKHLLTAVIQHQVTVAVNGDIQILAGGDNIPLGHVLSDTGNTHAAADFLRVGPPQASGRTAGTFDRLTQQFSKRHRAALKTRGVDICKIVTHHIQHRLMRL